MPYAGYGSGRIPEMDLRRTAAGMPRGQVTRSEGGQSTQKAVRFRWNPAKRARVQEGHEVVVTARVNRLEELGYAAHADGVWALTEEGEKWLASK